MKRDWNETSVDDASVTDRSFNASALYLCGSFSFLSALLGKNCPKQLKFSGEKKAEPMWIIATLLKCPKPNLN